MGDEVRLSSGPARQQLPVSSCPSGQAMQQGPSLQPQEPACAGSPEKGLKKGGAHGRPTGSEGRMGVPTAAREATGHRQALWVSSVFWPQGNEAPLASQTMAVVSSYRQGLGLGMTYWCRTEKWRWRRWAGPGGARLGRAGREVGKKD